ncbi:hypothetical protein [Polynucleobacter paneuropaeus]|uniref:Uncharacterized protein n=1 Tax=Polynucleobacter paneuropaeus TaxID=2527775 RepID=A0A2Z4JR05_9BURK|nr:hypothetical protein [Polynucleobacter paneuropaeus]AWW49197.1 hypothetical protein Pas1_01685 [Polynucleobacter paneuropaeus]
MSNHHNISIWKKNWRKFLAFKRTPLHKLLIKILPNKVNLRLSGLRYKVSALADWFIIEGHKRLPKPFHKIINNQDLDYFLSGKFHYEKNHSHISSELLPRIFLTKNEWVPYLDSTRQEDSLCIVNKYKEIGEYITIGFFCSYTSSHFFEKTILSYTKINSKIKWVLCKFDDFPDENPPEGLELVIFEDVSSAVTYCNSNVDFIIDADGPLRPTKTLEVLKHTSAYVLNYYNLITTSNKYFYDALIIPKLVTAAPFVSEKKIIGLNVLGGWNLPSLSLKINLFPKKYHFSIIAEQFKIGPEFLEEFATLSNKFKFIFIGMKYRHYLIGKLSSYGWNLKNVYFEKHMSMDQLQNFLKKNVYTILDIPNYSSGSGTIVGLSIGIPTICRNGRFWINQMAASIMNQTMNSDYIYEKSSQIENIIKAHIFNSAELEIRIEERSRKSGYLNPKIFLTELHQELKNAFQNKK